MTSKWHFRYMEVANLVSTWSKDPSTQVGAVAVDPDKKIILSTGYNGFSRGIDDSCDRLNDRDLKYSLMVHAEMNCIYNASYSGVSLNKSYLYVYGLPICSECAKGIIQTGINTVIVKNEFLNNNRWSESWLKTQNMFSETGVVIIRL